MTTKGITLTGVLVALAMLVGAETGWAVCCKCAPCPEPGIACFTTIATQDDCLVQCPAAGSGVCGFDSFGADATCGQGDFADCTVIDGQQQQAVNPAPTMRIPAIGLTALILLMAGVGLTGRRARKHGTPPVR